MLRSILPAVVTATLLLVSCGSPVPSGTVAPAAATQRIAGGTVTIRLNSDWGNPIDGGQSVTTANGIALAAAMYDTLVYLDVATGKVLPYVATSWTQTPTSITFKLRDDVVCADGAKVTPTVVYNSFARYISPELKSRWVQPAFGVGPYSLAKDDAAGTFTFTVARPFANLLVGMANATGSIICPKGLEPGADFTKASYGSGAYIFKSSVQGNEYVVTRRDGWSWGPKGMKSSDSGFPDTLVFKVVASDSTAANLLVTGGVDIAPVSGADVKRLVSDPSLEHQVRSGGAPYILAMNEAPERPTSSEVVRRAIATALDPKAWTVAAGEPDSPISTNIHTNPGGYCYTDLSALIPKPSVANARQMLLQAGYTAAADGKLQKDGKPLKLRVVGTNFTGSGIEYIADALQQVGITVDLFNTDYNTFAATYGKADYDILIGLHGGDIGTASRTPLFMVGAPPDKGGNNRLLTNDPKLQELVDRGYGAATEAEACQAWKEYNTYVLEHSIAIPWASAVTHWFSAKGAFSYTPSGPTLVPATVRRAR